MPYLKQCKICKKNFVSYSNLQSKCPACQKATAKPIEKFGKKAQSWDTFRKNELLAKELEDGGYWICEECGRRMYDQHEVHYHHIKTRGAHPELYFVRSNLMRLCPDCHLEKHGQKW